MFKYVRKHQKKFLAFFSVGLMVTFVISTGQSRGPNGNKRNDTVVATIKDSKSITASELEEARREWGAVTRFVQVPLGGQYGSRTVPFTQVAFGRDLAFGQQLYALVEQKPELFALLRREARDAGVRADNSEVETILTNFYQRPPNGDDMDDIVREGVTDIALIEANFVRMSSDIKVSAPLRDKALARVLQQIQVNVVELPAEDYIAKVAQPTTQQVQEQFNKYANVAPPAGPDAQNPLGFGYKYPERAKVQYLAINRSQAQQAVQQRMTPYEWDVQARIYYRQHKDEFPATQPVASTQPAATQMASALPTSQPTTGPAYKPYAEVATKALEAVQGPMVEKLMFDVQSRITSQMTNDWRSFQQASATTAPSADSAASEYPSYSYLRKVAESIQKQYGITIFASDFDRFASADELKTRPGIGQAHDGSNGRGFGGVEFADAAMQKVAVYLGSADKNAAAARAQLMQPSAPLQDLFGNVYIFRLTDARPSEAATNLDDVRDKVEADLKKAAAYDLALAAAKPVLEAAQAGGLTATAMAMGKRVILTDPFNSNPYTTQPPELGRGIALSPAAARDFADQAFGLLAQYNPTANTTPAKLITVPEDAKVFVAQLVKIIPQWDANTFYSRWIELSSGLAGVMSNDLRNDWFNYDAVVQRIGYKPVNEQKAAGG